MNIVQFIGLVCVIVGFALSVLSNETDKKRYIGWIILGTSISIFGVLNIIDGKASNAILDFAIGLLDYFLAYFWYKKYKDLKRDKELEKLNNRERFLEEIKLKRNGGTRY